jgi:hypothetical protein
MKVRKSERVRGRPAVPRLDPNLGRFGGLVGQLEGCFGLVQGWSVSAEQMGEVERSRSPLSTPYSS